VRRFLWDGEVVPFELTAEIVGKSQRLFAEQSLGLWAVRERSSPDLVGFAGFWHFRQPPSLELLFGVATEHWQRGIATEASRPVLRYGFERLGFASIEGSTDFGNTASIKVLEKLGMAFRRREVVDGLDTVFYTLRREDWERGAAHP
jgi:ribosomal-protein-alanine N-acetyltransferase